MKFYNISTIYVNKYNILSSLFKANLIYVSQVDVIVNSTSADLQLDKGALSKALSHAGGGQIQQACSHNYPNGITVGDVAVTTGGKLKCKEVFHIALKQYRGHGELQVRFHFIFDFD